jgi:ABC-type multidrug transport system fused ATPase/permease subunit
MHVLWRITKIAAMNPWRMTAAWVTLLASTGFFLLVPLLVGDAIDELSAGADSARMWWLGGVLVGAVLARGIFNYANLYLAESASQHVAWRIRNLLYDKFQHLSFAFHDREHTGNLMSKATVDVEQTRAFVSMGLVRSGQIIALVLGSGAIMLATDWQLALVALAFVPLVGWRAVTVSRRMRGMWRRVQAETGLLTTVLQENLAGQRVVKAFGAESHEEGKFAYRNQSVYEWTYTARRAQSANTSVMQVFFWGGTVAVLWAGGHAVMDGRVSVGELVQFIFYVGLLVQPVRMVGFLVNTFARTIAAGERLFDVLDAVSPVHDAPGARPLSKPQGRVRFEGVSFSYGGARALEGIDLDVPAGTVVALLGAPGSGKTTLVNLLARFYDASEGRVLIDGVDVRDATVASVRDAVGMVQQDVFLFSATVRENIAYGHRDATPEQVIAAAKTAQLHDEVMALPQGYDTLIGERGMSLSGGQRQRLALARTLLLDPPILVLDDSTASVDAGTEAAIQQAMGAVVAGRTTFVIAHRLSSIQHAQVVVVLERGRIAEMGSPAELAASGGLFTHMRELQYATNLNGHEGGRAQAPGISARYGAGA